MSYKKQQSIYIIGISKIIINNNLYLYTKTKYLTAKVCKVESIL